MDEGIASLRRSATAGGEERIVLAPQDQHRERDGAEFIVTLGETTAVDARQHPSEPGGTVVGAPRPQVLLEHRVGQTMSPVGRPASIDRSDR